MRWRHDRRRVQLRTSDQYACWIGIGTNLDRLSTLAAIHDNGLGHLVTGFLRSWQLCGCPIGLRFLDFQFDVLISS